MKIKVKKEMNLLELIEYIKKNEIADKVFFDNKGKGKVVVGDDRYLYMTDLNLTDTFTVEVEEEITKETVIPLLLELCEYRDGSLISGLIRECSTKEALYNNEIMGFTTHALYIFNNDDKSMTLIWRDGELVK
ncbi:hypothetical protein JL804_05785 [Staphylococcus pseudintermedius]|nr:hypothetical protein [Staphylococcus pseudintermedius]MCE5606105.1 hypothetical protein [Staphylococcus pseudintermedius]MCE5608602.1 hypothetical protein [Staphylococcus pseudintermedius]MCE5614518.1 hypothetical protein [Staphylococcus pseudintermedius]MCE5707811.1 hypothetical protein [Staphylococcus pseudintermedius]